jgi:exopolyphosphatase/guanosine-5'-triphosphate,3'-diphosphate pyrophosphatase
MVFAVIDIGTNTTRLLVAEPSADGLRVLLEQRVFTRVRRAQGPDGSISPAKLAELVDVVAAQARAARRSGASRVIAVATAAIRNAPNRGELVGAVLGAAGLELTVLDSDAEARLAFAGAVGMCDPPPPGRIAVIDLGGGWWRSVPVGSGTLCDTHLRGDPPTAQELRALREHAAGAFADLSAPPVDHALAVGGSATSLRRLCGAELDAGSLERALEHVTSAPCAQVAAERDLDPERVRLLPGALAVLEQAAAALQAPLSVSRGGLREGIILSAMDEER